MTTQRMSSANPSGTNGALGIKALGVPEDRIQLLWQVTGSSRPRSLNCCGKESQCYLLLPLYWNGLFVQIFSGCNTLGLGPSPFTLRDQAISCGADSVWCCQNRYGILYIGKHGKWLLHPPLQGLNSDEVVEQDGQMEIERRDFFDNSYRTPWETSRMTIQTHTTAFNSGQFV